MTALTRGLIVAIIHVAIVLSLGGKLLFDRRAYPRAWARTAPVDPDLPIRGRYVSLRLEAAIGAQLELPGESRTEGPDGVTRTPAPARPVALTAIDGGLVAVTAGQGQALYARARERDGQRVAELMSPVAFFIPEDADDPSRRAPGEELWAEVTIPPNGPPRPIRLAVKTGDQFRPLP